ncbi:hypothetical protein ACFL6C_08540 [Myxococcota bacterium]
MVRWIILLVPLAIAAVIFASVIRDLVRIARRRALKNDLEERMRERQQDALSLPGGRADNPIDIETPALVEPVVDSEKCVRCAGDLRLLEHAAERRGSDRLRIARTKCARCGIERDVFFRLGSKQLH